MTCPTIDKSLVRIMHNETENAVKDYPALRNHPNILENIWISSGEGDNSLTLHTHPAMMQGKVIDYPSPVDIKTTRQLKKDDLCIIVTPKRQVVCYNKKDNFKKKTCVFSY